MNNDKKKELKDQNFKNKDENTLEAKLILFKEKYQQNFLDSRGRSFLRQIMVEALRDDRRDVLRCLIRWQPHENWEEELTKWYWNNDTLTKCGQWIEVHWGRTLLSQWEKEVQTKKDLKATKKIKEKAERLALRGWLLWTQKEDYEEAKKNVETQLKITKKEAHDLKVWKFIHSKGYGNEILDHFKKVWLENYDKIQVQEKVTNPWWVHQWKDSLNAYLKFLWDASSQNSSTNNHESKIRSAGNLEKEKIDQTKVPWQVKMEDQRWTRGLDEIKSMQWKGHDAAWAQMMMEVQDRSGEVGNRVRPTEWLGWQRSTKVSKKHLPWLHENQWNQKNTVAWMESQNLTWRSQTSSVSEAIAVAAQKIQGHWDYQILTALQQHKLNRNESLSDLKKETARWLEVRQQVSDPKKDSQWIVIQKSIWDCAAFHFFMKAVSKFKNKEKIPQDRWMVLVQQMEKEWDEIRKGIEKDFFDWKDGVESNLDSRVLKDPKLEAEIKKQEEQWKELLRWSWGQTIPSWALKQGQQGRLEIWKCKKIKDVPAFLISCIQSPQYKQDEGMEILFEAGLMAVKQDGQKWKHLMESLIKDELMTQAQWTSFIKIHPKIQSIIEREELMSTIINDQAAPQEVKKLRL